MNLLAITKHTSLVEKIKTAFEGAGHRVVRVPDHLRALASEAWNNVQMIVVDVDGDPMDGYRFCRLLRGESRILFHNLPIYLILDHAPTEEDLSLLRDADGDGFIQTGDGIHEILLALGPALEGSPSASGLPQVPLVAAGIPRDLSERISGLLEHFGYFLRLCPLREVTKTQAEIGAPIVLLNVDATGNQALTALHALREHETPPYIILLGKIAKESLQRKLFLAGAMDWVPFPLSTPHLLQACRKGMEWHHIKRVQREFEIQIKTLLERRTLMEMEAASLRDEVLTDPLTELLNRRAFNQHLEHALNQWDRHKRSFVLILSDIDYFKLINDRFGHLVGDKVLRGIAQLIRTTLRKSDLAFRIGGEEFAILLPETNLKAGSEVADKIRKRIDEEPITLDSGQTTFPTMSFGLGVPEDHDALSLFSAVDQALYAAKHKGRNRLEIMRGQSI